MDNQGKMTEEKKAEWRKWLLENPEWQVKIAEFVDRKVSLLSNGVKYRMFWHDLVNVLACILGEAQLKRIKEGKK